MTIATYQAVKQICNAGEWRISNLKLQKMLYIAHKVYMGRNEGEPLINELFEAWDYGPVLPSLYHKLKMFGSDPIKDIFWDTKNPKLPFLEEACKHLLPMSGGKLVALTHREGGAWSKNYQPGILGIIIPNEEIFEEYKQSSKGCVEVIQGLSTYIENPI